MSSTAGARTASGRDAFDQDPRRWGMLALVSGALLLGMSSWFTATAVSSSLAAGWGVSSEDLSWLTSMVQVGFVAGTGLAALLNLADIWPSRGYFAASALLAAGANAALLVAPNASAGLGLRFATGFFLAGVYPPAMKMMATWFRSARGLAIGTVVGALTVGKATPWLLKAVGGAAAETVILGASAGGVVATLLVAAAYRDGPYPFATRPFRWSTLGRVLQHRPTLLATGGYLGHMWELYAVWAWLPLWIAAGQPGADPGLLDGVAFAVIAAGGAGCVWAGRAADRVGRERIAALALVVSGCCCLAAGLLFGAPLWLTALFATMWGFFVVADSAQFSALVTEVAPADAVGTALTLQTSLGFLLTMVTIQGVPELAAEWGWRWAFAPLALGPVAGIAAMRRLEGERRR